jgi:hypothetical protein
LGLALSQSACGKPKSGNFLYEGMKSGDVIPEDMPWFDSSIGSYSDSTDDGSICEFNELSQVGEVCDRYLLLSTGQYILPGKPTRQFSRKDLLIVDSGNMALLHRFKLYDYFDETNGISYFEITNNSVVLQGVTKDNDDTFTELNINLADFTTKVSFVDKDKTLNKLSTNKMRMDHEYLVNEWHVSTVLNFSESDSSYDLHISNIDNSVTTEVEVSIPNESVYDIPMITLIDDSRMLIRASCTDGIHYFQLNTKTMDLKECTSKYAWLDRYMDEAFVNSSDEKCYVKDDKGIYEVDLKTKSQKQIFNYNWCCTGEYDLRKLDISDCSSTMIEFSGIIADFRTCISKELFVTAKLTLAEKNPNSGKTVLEVYTNSNTLTPDVSYAMRVYNSEPNSCFLIKSTRYSVEKELQEDSYQTSNEKRNELIRSGRNAISSELSIDIINGTGPDILIDTAPLTQLENTDILMDLSKVASIYKEDKYFTNIISANGIKGAIFQLPLSFDVIGIQTRIDTVGASGRGFTYDEYSKFVDNYCNGIDPLYFGQTENFILLYSYNRRNGIEDFDSAGFYKLAEFCKGNMDYSGLSIAEYLERITKANNIPMTVSLSGLSDYCLNIGSGTVVCGLPSEDGQAGAAASVSHSVAISSRTAFPNECLSFIDLLLTYDAQSLYAASGYNVINRSAFKSAMSNVEEYLKATNYDIHGNELELYTSVIERIDVSYYEDPSVSKIITEELPAYFLEQKEYEDVLIVMKNKYQLIMKERGV